MQVQPNNSFKPKLLRSGNGVAEKACHAVPCATQFGLTQVLGVQMTITGMRVKAFTVLAGALLVVAANSNAGAPRKHVHPVTTLESAVAVAQRAAVARGIDLTRFKLNSTYSRLEGSEWLIGFDCTPPGPPGCSFLVVIQQSTGSAEVLAGE